MQRGLKLLHGTVKRRRQIEDRQIPSVTRVLNANPHAILAALILFDAATIVVANSGRTTRHDLTHRTPLKENFGNRRSNGDALLVGERPTVKDFRYVNRLAGRGPQGNRCAL